jgi:hypothetical protein
VTPSSITIQGAKKDIKGGRKRRKHHPQCITTMTGFDNDNDKQADNSDMERTATAEHSIKRQARLPTYHFERLLEEACLNHSYPVKQKLVNYSMMKSFMISGSLTRDMEPEENPSRSDVMPFPREDAVMIVYDRSSL